MLQKRSTRLAASIPFDVVLLSVHLFRGKDFYVDRECYKLPAKELHSEYIGLMAEMCEKCNNYDVAAHYDYINRYADNKSDFVTLRICFGSDSHFPGTFGVCFDEAIEYIKSFGFKEAVYFKQHKPYFEPL